MKIERNLLFGVLAVQLKFATPQQLLDTAGTWATRQEADLGALLVEQAVITPRQRQLISELINEQASAFDGDEGRVLATLGGDTSVAASFGGSFVRDRGSGSLSFAPLGGSETPAQQTLGGEGLQGQSEPERLAIEQPGRYTLRGEQGRGGIGRVLIAFDEYIGREIALKELLPEGASAVNSGGGPMRRSATLTARFLREARITGQLEHPGIVPVYELGRHADGSTYYTMKLVRGQTLGHRLKECRSLGDRLALLPHFLDLCQAIAYAHSREVIHRDIKPSNVMVGEFGETVLLDWGLAKVHGHADEGAEKLADEVRLLREADADQSVDGKPIGTPSYMPPEQADGRIAEIDERSDVWSLGAVLYELLTGRPPFVGSTAFEVIGMVLTDEVQPVLEVCKEAPPELAAIAMRCLQRDPLRRYQHVEELAKDAIAFQTGGLVGAYSYNLGKMLRRWVQKSWPVLVTAGVALAVLITVGTIAYAQVFRQNLALQAANKALDQSRDVLMAFKLATESHQAAARSDTELASLLALEAAKYYRKSGAWMPEAASALRYCAGATPFCHDLIGHSSHVRRVAFSPDGSLLVSSSDDSTIRIWDMTNSGAEPRVLRGHELGVSSIAFSPDGKTLASASHDTTLQLWDLATDQSIRVLRGHTAPVWAVAISPDGQTLASGSYDRTVGLWDLTQPGKAPILLQGHTDAVQAVAFSPDGRRLASCGDDGSIRLWRLDELAAAPEVIRPSNFGVMWIIFSPDGRTLVAGSFDMNTYLFDVAAPHSPPRLLRGHTNAVTAAAYSPDGKRLATASSDQSIMLWDLADTRLPKQTMAALGSGQWSVAFSPDGRWLASSSGERIVRLWDLESESQSPQILQGHSELVRCVSCSPSGKLLASGSKDMTIRLWNLKSPELAPRVLSGHEDLVSSVAFSPDETKLASASWDKTIRLWDLNAEPPKAAVLTGHTDRARAVVFSPDGRWLASCSDDTTVRIWELGALEQPPQVLQSGTEGFMDLAFSSDSRKLAAACIDRRVWLWDMTNPAGTPTQFLSGAEAPLLSVDFSPDNRLLAAGGLDQDVQLWDLESPDKVAAVLRGHNGQIYTVAFSPDSRLLASASSDNSLRIWNFGLRGSEPEILRNPAYGLFAVTFSPDGKTLISGGGDHLVHVFPVNALDLSGLITTRPWRNLSQDEWNKYVGPGLPYATVVPGLPPGEGVRAAGAAPAAD